MGTVRYLAPHGVDTTVAYQRYYLLGLEEVVRTVWNGPPLAARLVHGINAKFRLVYHLDRDRRALYDVARRRLGRPPGERTRVEGHVGRYVATIDGRIVRFAVDAHDARDVRDEVALGWSDVYFKSNRWSGAQDTKIVPIVNGNGLLDRRRIARLQRLRDSERNVDVAFIAYFRPARAHMLRLFEELARLPIRTDLLAVFAGVDEQDDADYMARLVAAGIPVTTRPLTPEFLWERLARAKIVVLRPGRHGCWPWRTIDLLCMGACIVLDAEPAPKWPVPLRSGIEFADCGILRPEEVAAPAAEYEKLAAVVMRLLASPEEAERLRTRAAAYFDTHAAPSRVAEHILRICAAGCR